MKKIFLVLLLLSSCTTKLPCDYKKKALESFTDEMAENADCKTGDSCYNEGVAYATQHPRGGNSTWSDEDNIKSFCNDAEIYLLKSCKLGKKEACGFFK